MTLLNASVISVCALAAGVQLTHAQSTVEIRQNGKRYILQPSPSKPITLTIKNKNGASHTVRLDGKSNLVIAQFPRQDYVVTGARVGRITNKIGRLDYVVTGSDRPAVIRQGKATAGAVIAQGVPSTATIVETPAAPLTVEGTAIVQAPAVGRLQRVEAPLAATGQRAQTIEVGPLSVPAVKAEGVHVQGLTAAPAAPGQTAIIRQGSVATLGSPVAPRAYAGTTRRIAPVRVEARAGVPTIITREGTVVYPAGQAVISTDKATLRELLIKARSKAAQEGKPELAKQLQQMIDSNGR